MDDFFYCENAVPRGSCRGETCNDGDIAVKVVMIIRKCVMTFYTDSGYHWFSDGAYYLSGVFSNNSYCGLFCLSTIEDISHHAVSGSRHRQQNFLQRTNCLICKIGFM